jgi:hypothetical protein
MFHSTISPSSQVASRNLCPELPTASFLHFTATFRASVTVPLAYPATATTQAKSAYFGVEARRYIAYHAAYNQVLHGVTVGASHLYNVLPE